VVVTDEVQQAVDQEVRDLAAKRYSRGLRLRARGLERDVDFPEVELAAPVGQIAGFGEGKGEHVRGAVDLEEIAVQGPDPRVVRQNQGDRSAREAQEPERAPEERPKSGRS
jgi:hypothetical protein